MAFSEGQPTSIRAPSRARGARLVLAALFGCALVAGGATTRSYAGANSRAASAARPPFDPGSTVTSVSAPEGEATTADAPPQGWVGVLVPPETTDLVPRLAGHLSSVNVRVGDRVNRGDVVATMAEDWQKGEAEVAGATKAFVDAEEERLRHEALAAAAQADRTEALAREGLASAEDLAKAKQAALSAKLAARGAAARRAEHGARATLAKRTLEATVLRAPFDAVVIARFVDTGAAVDPTTKVIRLGALGSPVLRFAVPAEQARDISTGACVESVEPPVRWNVARVAPEVDVSTHTLTAEAGLAAASPSLPFGAMLRVRRCP